jgi:ethanolamine utilization cobalamin adenosyltransferase
MELPEATVNLTQVAVLTEADLRVRNGAAKMARVVVANNAFVTPLAREYLHDHGIVLSFAGTEAAAGGAKPETMTHLTSTELVHKSHDRIYLRGQLDMLQAEIIMAETTAMSLGKTRVIALLDELLIFVRRLLASEVSGECLSDERLFGIELETFRTLSHQICREHTLAELTPHASKGRLPAEVNFLRARVRVCELAAVQAFQCEERPDLIRQLNRLSSAVFVLFYWLVSGLPEEQWHD